MKIFTRHMLMSALFCLNLGLAHAAPPSDQKLAEYDTIIKQYQNDKSDENRILRANALLEKGILFQQDKRYPESLAVFETLIKDYGNDTLDGVRASVASGMLAKGYNLGMMNQIDKSNAIYDELIKKFSNDTFAETRLRVARAHINKGNNLLNQGKFDLALKMYTPVIAKFAQDENHGIQIEYAKALYFSGYVYTFGKRDFKKGDEFYNTVIEKFSKDTDEQISALIFSALHDKAAIDINRGRYQQGIKALDELIKKHENTTNTRIKELLDNARNTRAQAQKMM